MRSSPGSRRAAWALALTTALAGAADVSAHRRDEYLQAARIAIEPRAVQVELTLTPGIDLAGAIVADIDRNRDGSVSQDERRAHALVVLGAVTLEVDGTPVQARLVDSALSDLEAVKRGEGAIRIQAAAALPRLPAGPHQLLFRNRHQPDRSVYLANALVPDSHDVAVTAQRRDDRQTELTIDYFLRAAPARSAAAWLLAGIAVATGLAGMMIQRGAMGRRRHRP